MGLLLGLLAAWGWWEHRAWPHLTWVGYRLAWAGVALALGLEALWGWQLVHLPESAFWPPPADPAMTTGSSRTEHTHAYVQGIQIENQQLRQAHPQCQSPKIPETWAGNIQTVAYVTAVELQNQAFKEGRCP